MTIYSFNLPDWLDLECDVTKRACSGDLICESNPSSNILLFDLSSMIGKTTQIDQPSQEQPDQFRLQIVYKLRRSTQSGGKWAGDEAIKQILTTMTPGNHKVHKENHGDLYVNPCDLCC